MLKMVLTSYTTASMFREAARPLLTKVNGTQHFGLSSVRQTQRAYTILVKQQLQAALVCALPAQLEHTAVYEPMSTTTAIRRSVRQMERSLIKQTSAALAVVWVRFSSRTRSSATKVSTPH